MPDFQGDLASVGTVARSGLDVYAHNVETVSPGPHTVRLLACTGAQLPWLLPCTWARPKANCLVAQSQHVSALTQRCRLALRQDCAAQVPRLQSVVRDRRANWAQSISTLQVRASAAAAANPPALMNAICKGGLLTAAKCCAAGLLKDAHRAALTECLVCRRRDEQERA